MFLIFLGFYSFLQICGRHFKKVEIVEIEDVPKKSKDCVDFTLKVQVDQDPVQEPQQDIVEHKKTFKMSLPKIKDEEKESTYGYVHAVSGPGMFHIIWIIKVLFIK